MSSLLEVIQWNSEAASTRQAIKARRRHQGFITLQLNKLLGTASLHSGQYQLDARWLRDHLVSLDDNTLIRIFDAPETCNQIYESRTNGEDRLTKYLINVIAAERIKTEMHKSLSLGVWTALGDCYFPGMNKATDHIRDDWLVDGTTSYAAPTTSDGIVIDYCSPYARRRILANNFRPEFSTPRRLDVVEVDEITPKVLSALSLLNSGSPSAALFVKQMLRTLMPRADASINGFQGGTSRNYIGRANLINAQHRGADAGLIATSLVHESIHTFLYIQELDVVPVSNYEVMYSPSIRSPWTDQTVHLLAFIHAAFVWCGLYFLWNLPGFRAEVNSRVAGYFLTTSKKGFEGGAMLAKLRPFKEVINPIIYEQLSEMQELMA